MNRIISDILRRYMLTALMLAMAVLVMPGCGDSTGPDSLTTADSDKPGRFKLRFQIVTRANPESRAADIDGDIEGSAAENYIDINNIRYLLFDSNQHFIADLTPKSETVAANEIFSIYNVVTEVDLPYFEEHIDDVVDFYILAIANYSGWGVTIPTLNEGDNISTLFDDGLTIAYRPSTPALMLAATPNVPATERQRFPMAGLQHFVINGSMLLASTDGTPYDITFASGKRLNMLRSFAKIEIIDRIDIAPGAVFDPIADVKGIRVKSAQLNGFFSRGRLLPNIINWRANDTFETQQVGSPTIPTNPDYHIPPVLNDNLTMGSTDGYSDYSLPFVYDEIATENREDKCPVYSCYVHEYLKTALSAMIPITQQPYFTVDIAEYTDPETGEILVEEMKLPMRMANYINGAASAGSNLVTVNRNHILRFEITGRKQQLQVNWTVCNMDEAEANIEFN